jgi:hypothetical protein
MGGFGVVFVMATGLIGFGSVMVVHHLPEAAET